MSQRRREVVLAVTLFAAPVGGGAADLWSAAFHRRGGQDEALAAIDLGGGRLAFAGRTALPGEKTRALLVELDVDGALLRQVAFGSDNPAVLASTVDAVILLAGGRAVATGRDVYDPFVSQHAWIAVTDAAWGAVAVQRLFTPPDPGGFGRWFLLDAVDAGDGGIAAAGSTSETDGSPSFPWLVKLDAGGGLAWQLQYGTGGAAAAALAATAAGGFVLAGSAGPGAGLGDAWLLKVDAGGRPLWQRTIGGADQEEATAVLELGDGSLVVSGWTASFTASGRAPWVLRLDGSGEVLWSRVFGGADWGDLQDLQATAAGDLLVVGRIGEPGQPGNDLWLVKLAAADGAVLWQKAYAGDQGDRGGFVLELGDGSLLAGGTWAWGFADESAWLLHLDGGGGLSGCGLLRDTAVVSGTPALIVDRTPAGSAVPAAVAVGHSVAAGPGVDAPADHCRAAACPGQGNVLYAVKRDRDVRLEFPAATGTSWRLYRDPGKREIGQSELPPDTGLRSFDDRLALDLTGDFYYALRAVCGGIPGP